jgi:hypothetical protein
MLWIQAPLSSRIAARCGVFLVVSLLLGSLVFGPSPMGPGPVLADSTPLLAPVADGAHQDWLLGGGGGGAHCDDMDEAPDCSDGDAEYVSGIGIGDRDSYTVDLGSIPDGATITSVDVSVCYRTWASWCTDAIQTFARLDGTDVDSGIDIVVDSDAKATTTQNIDVADTLKTGSTSLEIGLVKTGGFCWPQAYAVGAVVDYDTSPAFSDISGTVWEDLNGDGDQDTVAGGNPIDEPAFSGVAVELYDNPGCTGTPVDTTPTAGDGAYSFTSLPSGTYCVLVDSAALTPASEYYNTT